MRAIAVVPFLVAGMLAPIGPASAQYYPPQPRIYDSPSYRSPTPIQADDEPVAAPNSPSIYAPPGQPESYGNSVSAEPLPDPNYGPAGSGYPDAGAPPPAGAPVYRQPPQGYEPVDPRVAPGYGTAQPGYAAPQPGYAAPQPGYGAAQPGYATPQPGYGPAQPAYGAAPPAAGQPSQQDAMRPPMAIGPDQAATSALPPEDQPETGPRKQLPPQFRRTLVDYRTKEPAGTIIIDTPHTYLYLVLGNGKAMRYGIGVGREGFTWAGTERISRMAEWPDWHPPAEMIQRQPYLPRFMAGGETNPLGARALYLGKTLYRIHGTNQPSTIGSFVSSGCIRLTNEDIMDLYTRVTVGTRVVVLPGGHPPATASAAPSAPRQTSDATQPPYNPLAPVRTR